MVDDDAVRVIIQARSNSKRLPGKSLLPLGGLPIAVLAARRVARSGLEAIVATSTEPSDDALADLVQNHSVPVFRGDLHNVLARFRAATADMTDDGICVRMTADNVFPDDQFVRSMLAEFVDRDVGYLASAAGLPYGLAAEVFRVGSLRAATNAASSDYEREHVTPWIKEQYGSKKSQQNWGYQNLEDLRCTIDTFEDYLLIERIMRAQTCPVAAPFRDLVDALVGKPATDQMRPTVKQMRHALVLGTAQLGADYGRANSTGKVGFGRARQLVQTALVLGIEEFDTAAAYGDSEANLGSILDEMGANTAVVGTKLAPLTHARAMSGEVAAELAAGSVYKSLHRLKRTRLDALAVHRADHMTSHDGRLWKELKALHKSGEIGRLGVSVQSPAELSSAVANPQVDYVQLPYNVLDRRFEALLESTSGKKTPRVYVRSIYLQGLLVSANLDVWPQIDGVNPQGLIAQIDAFCDQFGRISREDLCLAFARSAPWVDAIVIGMETPEQVAANVELFKRPPLKPGQRREIIEAFSDLPVDLLDPARWPKLEIH